MEKNLRALSAAAFFAFAAPAFAAPALLDINSASHADLQSLKGIGDVRAKAIIAGRPYKGKDDIKDQIIAKQK